MGNGGKRYVVLCLEKHRRKRLPSDIFHFTPADTESRGRRRRRGRDKAFGSSAEEKKTKAQSPKAPLFS